MLPLFLNLALAAAPVPASPPSPGPSLPAVKGLLKPISLSAGTEDYVRWSLLEMGQAVVVVEGEMPLPLAKVNPGITTLGGKLRLLQPRKPLLTDLPVAPWMDLGTVGIPGNPAQKSYPIGWGY